MNKAKVLIADDELSMTNALSAILSSEGYDVAVAPDGKKAGLNTEIRGKANDNIEKALKM